MAWSQDTSQSCRVTFRYFVTSQQWGTIALCTEKNPNSPEVYAPILEQSWRHVSGLFLIQAWPAAVGASIHQK